MPKGKREALTEAQIERIKTAYLDVPVKRLADELGISFGRIMNFLSKQGLTIPKEIIEKRKFDSQLKKGDASWNKGRKQSDYMTPEAIERTKLTRFKKGNIPHNTKVNDGIIVSRRDKSGRIYKYIRVSVGKWELLHRHIWEKANGKIERGNAIVFKDGNTQNVVLSNLEMISLTENMLRNSIHNYPDEIIPSMALILKLESKLKSIQNG